MFSGFGVWSCADSDHMWQVFHAAYHTALYLTHTTTLFGGVELEQSRTRLPDTPLGSTPAKVTPLVLPDMTRSAHPEEPFSAKLQSALREENPGCSAFLAPVIPSTGLNAAPLHIPNNPLPDPLLSVAILHKMLPLPALRRMKKLFNR